MKHVFCAFLFTFVSLFEFAKSFEIPPGAKVFNSTPDENYTETQEYKDLLELRYKEGNWTLKVDKKVNMWDFNDTNLEEFVNAFDIVMVEFYARFPLF